MQKTLAPRYYALFLLAAFAINAVLPFYAVHNPVAGFVESRYLASVFGDKILICTGSSFKWVKIADLQSGKEKPKSHSGDQCQLCQTAYSGFTPTNTSLLEKPGFEAASAPVFYHAELAAFSTASPPNMRAPPAFL